MKTLQQKNQPELNLIIPPGGPARDTRAEAFVAQRLLESPTGEVRLMESILESGNLQRALKRVQKNDGAPGVDGMTVNQLSGYLRRHWPEIEASILSGTYKPFPFVGRVSANLMEAFALWLFPRSSTAISSRRLRKYSNRSGTTHFQIQVTVFDRNGVNTMPCTPAKGLSNPGIGFVSIWICPSSLTVSIMIG